MSPRKSGLGVVAVTGAFGPRLRRRWAPAFAGESVFRRAVRALLVVFAASLPQLACAQEPATARAAESSAAVARYERIVEEKRAVVAADPANPQARRELVAALATVGRYTEALDAAGDLANLRGEMLLTLGRTAEAEAAFRRAIEEDAHDRLTAELNLARLLYHRGERDEALRRFDRFIDVYNQSSSLPAPALVAVGTAVRYLGTRDPQLFHDALKAYDEAIAADPRDIEPRLLVGELFLDKYNSPDAQASFREVLAQHPDHPRALLGLARAKEFDREIGEAFELVLHALQINPNLVDARLALARMLLETEDVSASETEVRRALEVNPESLDGLALLAAIEFLRGNRSAYESTREQVRRLNPRFAGVALKTAEAAARQRRYAEAVELAHEAVRLDAEAWDAYGVLGLNQLRVGEVDAARASLERSFAGDPFNVWIKNNLDLLDTYPQYETRTVGGIELFLHRDESELLSLYVRELAEEAVQTLSARYGYRPERLRIEMYPRHADFSVRTVGLAGLGALGVSFGPVVALDSPAARDRGTFNWGSTLWHEIAHSVTMGASRNRVSRWLTEGLSVLEERRARPGWGSRTTPEFMAAYLEGELPPASRLNEGFLRPASAEHLSHAYHMASLVAEWIEETQGFDAIVRMLRAYGEGRGSAEVFRTSLGADPEMLDQRFDAWLRERHPPARAAEYFEHLTAGRAHLAAGRTAEAQRSLEAAAALFPVSRGTSAYALLAELHLREGRKREAADALTRLSESTEAAYAENLQLAELLEELGDTAGAAVALERALLMHPYEMPVHLKLADLYTSLGEMDKVVRQRRAVVALRPVDRAEAFYQLARALHTAGDRTAARREVLRALEIAPGFERAQELLLELRGEG